eukprot:6469457-Alexandrium_andersonii.AAC.1
MAFTWRADAGASSTKGGKMPDGARCRRTPSGAPESSQSARSASGSVSYTHLTLPTICSV